MLKTTKNQKIHIFSLLKKINTYFFFSNIGIYSSIATIYRVSSFGPKIALFPTIYRVKTKKLFFGKKILFLKKIHIFAGTFPPKTKKWYLFFWYFFQYYFYEKNTYIKNFAIYSL